MDENQIGNDLKRMVHSWLEDLPLRGESSLSLMLKVIRLMCEGQYELLQVKKLRFFFMCIFLILSMFIITFWPFRPSSPQDYLRIQPDNYMSVNIVSEIVALIQMVVSNKKQPGPKELLIELIHTLSEMVAVRRILLFIRSYNLYFVIFTSPDSFYGNSLFKFAF